MIGIKTYIFKILRRVASRISGSSLGDRQFVKSIYHFLYRYLIPNKLVLAKIEDRKYYVDPQDYVGQMIMINGYENFETRVLKDILKSGMTVIDIGAHLGYYTIIASKMVGPKGKVYAFEPNPYNYELLEKNVNLNEAINIIPVKKAVSNQNGQADMFFMNEASGKHSLFKLSDGDIKFKVGTITIDEYFKDIPVDVVKMDAEGAEPYIIEGMKGLIARSKNLTIITEYYPERISIAGCSPREYFKQFVDNGFEVFNIDDSKMSIERIGPASPPADIELNDFGLTNLLCIKSG